MHGDPDKPIILGAVYRPAGLPPAFTHTGSLPGNRYVSGLKTQEIKGGRYNQLRMDDTPGQISAQLASEHAHSQVNLGYLTHPRADGRGQARGEGAEVRSDDSVAIRSAKALLISAWKRLNANDRHLSRDDYLGLMQDSLDLFRSLGQDAARHQALDIDDKGQDELKQGVKNWEAGSNTDPQGRDGGAPSIGITAPEGIGLATPKTLMSYAGVNIDSVAQQHMQYTAGQRFNLNAGQGISLFAHHGGIRAIAHQGPFSIQSQHGDTHIDSARNIQVRAVDNVTILAKVHTFIAEDGSFIKIGGGGITLGSNGPIAQKAASFPHSGPATLAAEAPVFSRGTPDQKFVLKYGSAGGGGLAGDAIVAANRRFAATLSDGSVVQGVSDAEGRTPILDSDAMHIARIDIFKD